MTEGPYELSEGLEAVHQKLRASAPLRPKRTLRSLEQPVLENRFSDKGRRWLQQQGPEE